MPDANQYKIRGLEQVMTPALVIFEEAVDHNIEVTVRALGGDADRWRPHIKTAKLAYVLRKYVARGIKSMKCATTLELITACEAGAEDVLVAYPMVGANAVRVREIALKFPNVRISILVENADQAEAWRGWDVGLFVDVNPGMNRTGIDQWNVDDVAKLAAGLENFRGLHYYDGHMHIEDQEQRRKAAHAGYDQLIQLVSALDQAGVEVEEVITSGTPAMSCAIEYEQFTLWNFRHRVSPGTVVYGDSTSLNELPPEYDYRPAVFVLSTVVSRPLPDRVTCDGGHKSVSADAGVPTCAVLEHRSWMPRKPSEEHLPIDLPAGETPPAIGTHLFLLPRHVCPTVNNFDEALIIRNGEIALVERVTARGHEGPLAAAWREISFL